MSLKIQFNGTLPENKSLNIIIFTFEGKITKILYDSCVLGFKDRSPALLS